MTLCGNELCSHQQCATMRRDQRRAEWRLNEAAAELLEACKFAEDWVHTFLPHQGPAENKLLDVLQSAIAKAERVQP